MNASRPISLTVAALGGQGGGVVTDWLVAAARRAEYLVQATSVPGVAQRTGATIYYLEFFPRSAVGSDGREPIMALMPNPGDVDIVVASEWLEAARTVNRGLVTPDRTTLIASTHREYTIGEKSALVDGRTGPEQLRELVAPAAKTIYAFDMAALADSVDGRISAVILGSIAAAGVLPWPHSAYREAIEESGIGVQSSLVAFDAGVSATAALRGAAPAAGRIAVERPAGATDPLKPQLVTVREQIVARFPSRLSELLTRSAERLLDYQDSAYVSLFLERTARFSALDPADGTLRLSMAVARALALWMSFEDVMRVAQIKTRGGRHARIRREVQAAPRDLVSVTEFVRPRVAEICATLPAGVGRKVLRSRTLSRGLAVLTRGWCISTSTIGGFLLLRLIAISRRWRRGTLRYATENQRIDAWLTQIEACAVQDYELALEVAECQSLVTGYGETHDRGWSSFRQITGLVPELIGDSQAAARLRQLRNCAVADDTGAALALAIAALATDSSRGDSRQREAP